MNDVIIIGGARDYHAMDWYRAVRKNFPRDKKISFLTDSISGEGFKDIRDENDIIDYLFVIDKLLLREQSKVADKWRNIVKLLVLPLQVVLLYLNKIKNKNPVYHAHPMYYMFLCSLAGVRYVGTPQGSEILVRPSNSKLYKIFAIRALKSAMYVTVDSKNMQEKIFELSGVKAIIVQNGIDVVNLLDQKDLFKGERSKVSSIRGVTQLYRIQELLDARRRSCPDVPISLAYPFSSLEYYESIKNNLMSNDEDYGSLNKIKFYRLLFESKLVVSIPSSDSSPRSVYESIFAGAAVAITYNSFYEDLPDCMKSRIYIVELSNINWLKEALTFAEEVIKKPYLASDHALEMFDQNITMKNIIKRIYN